MSLTMKMARWGYGVVVDPKIMTVDDAATRCVRREHRLLEVVAE